ncbi:helix-turn-helix domain-containing protein [Ottowia testudinis]|uniref:Helix-turn-helix transcriptional regulator n=1 Tax=Ottowia testudinis TaxID=2816950 RepID=A0A975CJQ8_9BURK|nr:helix-turn-helix transcriptional regulator [Ottowia testudinis]QTD46346.1 helix-turn-helix transcriptional regulator [Ottowia testudinis]
MELETGFGKVLRKLREERELTQEALAFEAGISRNYVSLMELGQKSPSLRTLQALSNALGVSLTVLMQRLESELAQGAKAARRR